MRFFDRRYGADEKSYGKTKKMTLRGLAASEVTMDDKSHLLRVQGRKFIVSSASVLFRR